jgi:putative pyruvate formate lyase activating enzyme
LSFLIIFGIFKGVEPAVNSLYYNCQLCPRRCGIDRQAGQLGFCGETSALRIGFAGIHKGEEPPITSSGGSGTIFVTGCNLGCAFCQNFQISGQGMGRAVEVAELAEICLLLQEKGAENINIVTGNHAAPALALGIEAARKQGLFIPILWNSSGYDGIETLEILKDFVDVYLPDLKTVDSGIAVKFFNAPDYPEHATMAIRKMMEYQKPRFGTGRNGAEVMYSGVMVRHLVIPGFLENTRQVLRWFADNCQGALAPGRALLSVMTRYTPIQVGSRKEIPGGYVLQDEYEAVMAMLDEFGIEDGYCQELVIGSDWLPDFKRPNPFSSELSVPLWHWKKS